MKEKNEVKVEDNYQWYMQLALEQAEIAYKQKEVPIGAVIISETGIEYARANNQKESVHNPCGHAEILAIQMAAKKKQAWRLDDAILFVTLEPCPMCLSAMVQARIKMLVFGAYDTKGGALSLGYNLYKDERLNHRFPVVGGIQHYACSTLLSRFFRERREDYNRIQKR